MKVRITIEYDNDRGEPTTPQGVDQALWMEQVAWFNREVGIDDILELARVEGNPSYARVKFERID